MRIMTARTADTPDARAGFALWAIIAMLAGALWAACTAAGLSLNFASGAQPFAIVGVLCGIAWIYRARRPAPAISHAAEASAQLISILLLGALLGLALAPLTAGTPYRDPILARADRLLGFDWTALNGFATSRRWLIWGLWLAYMTMVPQFVAVIGSLAAAGQPRRLQRFTLALAITLSLTLAIFPVVPALGYHAFLGLQMGPPAQFMEQLRAGAVPELRADALDGLVTFPSFHTAAAVLFMWAFWTIRLLRWPALGLNLLVVASTPVIGSHYLVDILAGAGVASVAILAASRLVPDQAPRSLAAQGTAAS